MHSVLEQNKHSSLEASGSQLSLDGPIRSPIPTSQTKDTRGTVSVAMSVDRSQMLTRNLRGYDGKKYSFGVGR